MPRLIAACRTVFRRHKSGCITQSGNEWLSTSSWTICYRTVYTQTHNTPTQSYFPSGNRMDNNKHIDPTVHEASLPVELLHVIVSHTTADYLDDLIAGQLSVMVSDPYRRIGVQLQGLIQHTYKARLHSGVMEPIPVEPDKTLEKDNPIISLLQSSVKLRAITLKILSNILGIPLSDENGIERSVSSTAVKLSGV